MDKEAVEVDQRSPTMELDQADANLDLDSTSARTISKEKVAFSSEFLLVYIYFPKIVHIQADAVVQGHSVSTTV